MIADKVLDFIEKFCSKSWSTRVCFFLALLVWFLQMLILGTKHWVKTSNSTVGLWSYCSYSLTGFECCQSVDNFLIKNRKIPSIPVWLSAVRVFEILGLISSFALVGSLIIRIATTEANWEKTAKKINTFFAMATGVVVLIGWAIYFAEYKHAVWIDGAEPSFSLITCIISSAVNLSYLFVLFLCNNNNAIDPENDDELWQGQDSAPGTNEFWEKMLNYHNFPLYWTQFKGECNLKNHPNDELCKPVKASQSEFNDVKDLFESTYIASLVGKGLDATNIYTKSVSVTNVERIEKVELWHDYIHARDKIIRKILKRGPFKKLESISNCLRGPVNTSTKKHKTLNREINPDMNEYYLFHGTKSDIVGNVINKGLDPRHSGDKAMMGRGIYCAEVSMKSDQYADDKNNRRTVGLTILLVRMVLGNIYVATKPKQFKMPPCTTCLTDRCTNESHEHFDSVVADIPNKLFREFIVYDGTQCYPEYLITYNRY